ncbi:hypothetical protein [Dyadobacter pollutisoli]|jgi:hypothetical protein|uniref:Lipoprotein n=1 Tax=Dyadobacter pollutisoli TaxID=2910158 RepID=A0A9E8SIM5_9BACT|nr:hypothetical protein [Dyadobacter pollutisoli]WAC09933.1 hypothetical protein ON006_19500 [Dyadobacter pollutisoli]
MKRYFLFVLTIAGIVSCKSSGVDKKEEGIKYKETVTLNDVPKATLTFFGLQDSRCPENVQCVWAGNATVDLLLSGVTTEGGVNEHVKMCLGQCDQKFKEADTLDKKFAGEDYRLILNAVKPYPKVDSTRKIEDTYILLKIEKK